jgi:hypothetical protein
MERPDRISRLVQVADQLRKIRAMQRSFLTLWAVDDAARRKADPLDPASRRALADPYNRDWSILYRGSVLDD